MPRRPRRRSQSRQRVSQVQNPRQITQQPYTPIWLQGDAGTTRLNIAMAQGIGLAQTCSAPAFTIYTNGGAGVAAAAAAVSSAMTLTLTRTGASVLGDFVRVTYDGRNALQPAGGGPDLPPFDISGQIAQA